MMLRNVLICAVLTAAWTLMLVEGQSSENKCEKENMHYKTCGTNCPKNCTNMDAQILCDKHCVPDCFCNDGYVLEDNNSKHCILEMLCKSCKGNSRYSTCGSECPPTCDNYKDNVTCNDRCVEGCVCKEGYILTSAKSGECVLPSECH